MKSSSSLTILTAINSRFKIRSKIWFGFALMTIVLCIVALSAIRSLLNTQSSISAVVELSQPMTFHSMMLLEKIERSAESLGFFLIGKDQESKAEYFENIKAAKAEIKTILNLPLVKQDLKLAERVLAIEKNIIKYHSYHEELFKLTIDSAANMPAMMYAASEINPVSQQLLQLVSQAILSEDEEEATSERKSLLNDFNNLRYAWANVMNGVRAFLAFRGQNSLAEIKLYSESAENLIKKIESNADILTLDQEDSMMQFAELFLTMSGKFDRLHEMSEGQKWHLDADLLRTKVSPLLHIIGKQLSSLITEQKTQTELTSKNLLIEVEETSYFVITMLVIGIGVALIAGWIISFMITNPLNNAVQAMNDIAEGEGDLTSRLTADGSDEISLLAKGFNNFVAKVQDTISEVSGSTAQLAAAAEEMSLVTNETREGTNKQQSETDLVAAAMTEMASTVVEVSNHANTAAVAAQQADIRASEGHEVVNKTIDSVNALAHEIEKASEVINTVEKNSENIGSVLTVIQGIAEQTNLLALNAAIEAARAGEQGRGFAVVADEVRTLASRTKESTREIQTMIEGLQTGTQNAVAVMELSRNKARDTVDQATQAGVALQGITLVVDEINQMNNQIAQATEQQGSVAEEININIVNITEIATQTALGADQLTSASSELATLSSNLQLLVARFKV